MTLGPGSNGLLTPARLIRFGAVVAVGMAVALVLVVATADGTATVAAGRLGGDWAAFRTAGVLLMQDPDRLLDIQAQRVEMAPYLDGNFAPFPYPPIFGYAFVPFALVDFGLGYLVYVMLLVALGLAGIWWTMDLLGVSRKWRPVGLLGGITYAGTFTSWGGAQNATITLAILAGSFLLLDRGHPVGAGAVLTLLWFKPQFAIPVLALILVARQWRTAVTALAGGMGLYMVHVLVFGPDWGARWYDVLTFTDRGNLVFNTSNTVSPVELLRGTLVAPWADVVGLGLALVIGVGFAWLSNRNRGPAALLSLCTLALLLTAPHALRYELTLLIPAIGVLTRTRGPAFGLGAWVLGGIMVLPVPPLTRILYVATVGLLVGLDLQRGATEPLAGSSRTTLDSTFVPRGGTMETGMQR